MTISMCDIHSCTILGRQNIRYVDDLTEKYFSLFGINGATYNDYVQIEKWVTFGFNEFPIPWVLQRFGRKEAEKIANRIVSNYSQAMDNYIKSYTSVA